MKKRPEPWKPSEYDYKVVLACKAIAKGEANAEQQQMVANWLINNVAGTYDEPYYENSDRNTTYALGKAYVGRQLVKMINYPNEAMDKLRQGDTTNV